MPFWILYLQTVEHPLGGQIHTSNFQSFFFLFIFPQIILFKFVQFFSYRFGTLRAKRGSDPSLRATTAQPTHSSWSLTSALNSRLKVCRTGSTRQNCTPDIKFSLFLLVSQRINYLSSQSVDYRRLQTLSLCVSVCPAFRLISCLLRVRF